MAGAASAGVWGAAADSARGAVPTRAGRTREYWLQIEHQPHDLAPTKFDPMMGQPITIRTQMHALVYRAYSRDWRHPLTGNAFLGPNTGFPGPVLRGLVGDTLVVHVRNSDNYYKQPHSLHAHGVTYEPADDGGWRSDRHHPGAAIPVGGTHTYTFHCAASSVGTWPYHDHSKPFHIAGAGDNDNEMGMSAGAPTMEIGAELGLMGHVIVDEPGATRPDREIYLLFHDIYADDLPDLDGDVDCFNGGAFLGNTPTFHARVGERIRWHVVALGTEFHVFHIHGHRWKSAGGRYVDSEVVGPATSLVADFVEDNPGEWLYHCHVVDHMIGGMVGSYRVTE